MDIKATKSVIIMDESLPLGLIANTAAIMGITLGKEFPEIVGEDVQDGSGCTHTGITALPLPILKSNKEYIKEVRQKLLDPAYDSLFCIDFSDVAQNCLSYPDYTEKIGSTPECDLQYLGICLCGSKKQVNRLCGSLPLLR